MVHYRLALFPFPLGSVTPRSSSFTMIRRQYQRAHVKLCINKANYRVNGKGNPYQQFLVVFIELIGLSDVAKFLKL